SSPPRMWRAGRSSRPGRPRPRCRGRRRAATRAPEPTARTSGVEQRRRAGRDAADRMQRRGRFRFRCPTPEPFNRGLTNLEQRRSDCCVCNLCFMSTELAFWTRLTHWRYILNLKAPEGQEAHVTVHLHDGESFEPGVVSFD